MIAFTRAAAMAVALATASALPTAATAAAPDSKAVIATYEAIAYAMFQDAHAGAVALKAAVDKLVAAPSENTLAAARSAWVASRPAYRRAVERGGPFEIPA